MPRPSPLDNEQCRQCTSFSDYMKQNRKKMQKDGGEEDVCLPDEAPVKPLRDDCPLDKDELGKGTWGLLHTIAAKYPTKPSSEEKKEITTFFQIFSRLYPCESCAEDLRDDIKKHPPKVESQQALSQWLCDVHNRVNVRLDKPKFDCSRVNERWLDGWKDGSCDY